MKKELLKDVDLHFAVIGDAAECKGDGDVHRYDVSRQQQLGTDIMCRSLDRCENDTFQQRLLA